MLSVKRLSHEDAAVMIEAAEKMAAEIAVPMCIAVTDESGALIMFSRMDGGKFSSIRIAIDKAFTAAAARNPTSFYSEICRPGHPTFGIHVTNEGHFCVIGGGVPVLSNGVVVGAIGVSSGTPDQDIVVAEAGVSAMDGRL